MSLASYVDMGASLGPEAPCLTIGGRSRSYAEVQDLSRRVAGALTHSGVRPGDTVVILSANDPMALICVFGIARAGAVWCSVDPRDEADRNRELLERSRCTALLYQPAFAPLVSKIRDRLPQLRTVVSLGPGGRDPSLEEWVLGVRPAEDDAEPPDDVAMLVGTAGVTGRPMGVRLTGRHVEKLSAATLTTYPFEGRPTYLAFAPVAHAAGVLCFPVLALGGEVVVMPAPDLAEFLALIERHRVTHTFLPPTLIARLLAHPALDATDLSSLQCLWYDGAPISADRLEDAIAPIGPVMRQLFGQ
jgi:fatty-acyl-CoA synthase